MAIKITPTLYIGLGGTGARALLRAKQCFIDAYGQVPSMVDFLAIDTDNITGVIKSNKHGDIKLGKNEMLFITETNAASKYNNFPSDYSWIPSQNVRGLSQIAGTGAGQIRSNGRFILQENEEKVATAVQNKLRTITQATLMGAAYQHSTKADGSQCPAIVNIVGSIAGGTGCGMMVDMLHIVPRALNGIGISYFVYPWILMPDVYRSAYPRMSNSVYLNAYGALRELDYLFNLTQANNNPLTFGKEKIKCLDKSVQYAYIINNFNSLAGTIKEPNAMADSIGRSMFLPTNDMGAVVATPMDNIRVWKQSFDLNAQGKSCWCATSGSAEIVYDSQIVGDNIGYALIRNVVAQLCNTSQNYDSIADVLRWMSSPEVNIQEDQADQLIDSLLDAACPYEITLDKSSTVQDIENFIQEATNVDKKLNDNYQTICQKVSAQLKTKFEKILNSANGVGDANSFLATLVGKIAICEQQMNEEIKEHQQAIGNHEPWDSALKGLRTFWGGTDKEAAEALSQTIYEQVRQIRETERKKYALNVYSVIKEEIAECQKSLMFLTANLDRLKNMMSTWIMNNMDDAKSNSIYRVNLHANALEGGRVNQADDSLSYVQANNVKDLLEAKNENELFNIMKPWADKHQDVRNAFAVDIDSYLQGLPQDKVVEILSYAKKMSSPMWNVDFQGKLKNPKEIIQIFVIGCNDGLNNVIVNNEVYKNVFTSSDGIVKPDFATITSHDRIQILTLECCVPVYAVNNTTTYEREFNQYTETQAGYLDQIWNQRMISENFQVIPSNAKSGPDPLEIWVKSIILGIVSFNNDQYRIKSTKQGDPLKKYLVDIGANREVAFEAFKSMSLYLEAKETIDGMVSTKGKSNIQDKFGKVSDENYYEDFSIVSKKDRMHIEEPAYKQLQDLMRSEISFIAGGGLKV